MGIPAGVVEIGVGTVVGIEVGRVIGMVVEIIEATNRRISVPL